MTEKDDELDQYLDDVLQEFSEEDFGPKKEPAKQDTLVDEEFLKLLQQNMGQLLQGEDLNEMLKNSSVTESKEEAKDFKDTINQTMNKMKESSKQEQAEQGGFANFDDAAMESMMKELEGLMENGDFEDAFGGVLNELVSKELLHEPMKELAGKYPEWLTKNKGAISAEEFDRISKQQVIVEQIVAVFDNSAGKDLNAEETKVVMELMQNMQDFGNPPDSLMEEVSPGSGTSSSNKAEVPPECNQM